MASRSSCTAAGGDAASCTRAISPATRGSSAARWIAATASRSAIGRPPPVMIASGSKPVVSGGAERRSSSSTQPLGTPWWRAVSTRLARARTSSTPGSEGRKANMVCSLPISRRTVVRVRFSIAIPQFDYDGFDAEPGCAATCPRRGARVRGRLGARADHRRGAAAGAAGAAGLLRGVHRATAPGGRRPGDVVARSASVGLGRDRRRPAQPRPAGHRRRDRRRLRAGSPPSASTRPRTSAISPRAWN